ncbi:hypothetical protein ACFLZY_02945 [Patescibacteria group bacterium]
MRRSPEMGIPIEEIKSAESSVEDFELDNSEPNLDLQESMGQEQDVLSKYSGKAGEAARMFLLASTLLVGVGLSSEVQAEHRHEDSSATQSETKGEQAGSEMAKEAVGLAQQYSETFKAQNGNYNLQELGPISFKLIEMVDFGSSETSELLGSLTMDDIDGIVWALYSVEMEMEKVLEKEDNLVMGIQLRKLKRAIKKYQVLGELEHEADQEQDQDQEQVKEHELTEAGTKFRSLLDAFRKHLKHVKDEKHAQAAVRTVTKRFLSHFYYPQGLETGEFSDSDNLLIAKSVENLILVMDFLNDKYPVPQLDRSVNSLNRIKGRALRKLTPEYKMKKLMLKRK